MDNTGIGTLLSPVHQVLSSDESSPDDSSDVITVAIDAKTKDISAQSQSVLAYSSSSRSRDGMNDMILPRSIMGEKEDVNKAQWGPSYTERLFESEVVGRIRGSKNVVPNVTSVPSGRKYSPIWKYSHKRSVQFRLVVITIPEESLHDTPPETGREDCTSREYMQKTTTCTIGSFVTTPTPAQAEKMNATMSLAAVFNCICGVVNSHLKYRDGVVRNYEFRPSGSPEQRSSAVGEGSSHGASVWFVQCHVYGSTGYTHTNCLTPAAPFCGLQ